MKEFPLVGPGLTPLALDKKSESCEKDCEEKNICLPEKVSLLIILEGQKYEI